jgi:hypothetical protein
MKQKMRSNQGLADLEYLMVFYCKKEKESIRKHFLARRPLRRRDCELPQMSKVSEEETVQREGAIGKL